MNDDARIDLSKIRNLLPSRGDVRYIPRFFSKPESARLIEELLDTVVWKHESIVIFGKPVLQPRLTALYGDTGREYRYSGITMKPSGWNSALLEIKNKIESHLDLKFNVALLNYYRGGDDSMGWHRDNEKELGTNPVIGSVSFGVTRALKFRLRESQASQSEKQLTHRLSADGDQSRLAHLARPSNRKTSIELEDGSFLLMRGETQHNWYHAVMKSKRPMGSRINITFRNILDRR